jgi:hypothetical protein
MLYFKNCAPVESERIGRGFLSTTAGGCSPQPLPGVVGLVAFGFPLHPAGKPSAERGQPLAAVNVPMLFLRGTGCSG